jgi:hypothetical protein
MIVILTQQGFLDEQSNTPVEIQPGETIQRVCDGPSPDNCELPGTYICIASNEFLSHPGGALTLSVDLFEAFGSLTVKPRFRLET